MPTLVGPGTSFFNQRNVGSSGTPGVPFLGSTTIIPGASPSTPATPDYINLLNQLNLQGQQAANAARVPGSTALEEKSSANIGAELAGQLPPDVLNLIQQQGAERGVETGSPGSPNAEAATLAALGLTSLQQEQTGQANLTAADARNPVAPLVDLTGMLLTPYEAGNLTLGSQRNLTGTLGALGGPGPYTGPGSGVGSIPFTGTTPTTPNWASLLGGIGTPSYGTMPTDGTGVTTGETFGTTSGVPEFDPTTLDWTNPTQPVLGTNSGDYADETTTPDYSQFIDFGLGG